MKAPAVTNGRLLQSPHSYVVRTADNVTAVKGRKSKGHISHRRDRPAPSPHRLHTHRYNLPDEADDVGGVIFAVGVVGENCNNYRCFCA